MVMGSLGLEKRAVKPPVATFNAERLLQEENRPTLVLSDPSFMMKLVTDSSAISNKD